MPWPQMKKAIGLPGKAFVIYMGLWVLHCAMRKREIALKRKFFDGSGLGPTTITRGIDDLAEAGLIDIVDRGPGKTPVLYLRKEKEIGQL